MCMSESAQEELRSRARATVGFFLVCIRPRRATSVRQPRQLAQHGQHRSNAQPPRARGRVRLFGSCLLQERTLRTLIPTLSQLGGPRCPPLVPPRLSFRLPSATTVSYRLHHTMYHSVSLHRSASAATLRRQSRKKMMIQSINTYPNTSAFQWSEEAYAPRMITSLALAARLAQQAASRRTRARQARSGVGG